MEISFDNFLYCDTLMRSDTFWNLFNRGYLSRWFKKSYIIHVYDFELKFNFWMVISTLWAKFKNVYVKSVIIIIISIIISLLLTIKLTSNKAMGHILVWMLKAIIAGTWHSPMWTMQSIYQNSAAKVQNRAWTVSHITMLCLSIFLK